MGRQIPQGVKILLIINGVMFLLKHLIIIDPTQGYHPLISFLGLTPAKFWKGMFWQPLTYLFLHGGMFHLLFNMLILWMFGSVLESMWGTKRFLQYYFLTGVGPGILNCIFTPTSPIPIIGASGSMYGLLTAYGILFPNALIYLSFLFPIRAKYLVIMFGLFEFFNSIRSFAGAHSYIAHFIHLGGMLIGLVYLKKDALVRSLARKMKNIQSQKQQHQQKKKFENEERLQKEVDKLLDRINEVGWENLSDSEKKRLKEVSEFLKEMNQKYKRNQQ